MKRMMGVALLLLIFVMSVKTKAPNSIVEEAGQERESIVESGGSKLDPEEFSHRIQAMHHPEDLREEIERLKAKVDVEALIAKLNQGVATQTERALFADYLSMSGRAHQHLIELELAELERSIE